MRVITIQSILPKDRHGFTSTAIKRAEFPLIANSTAREVKEPEEIKDALIGQLTHPVLWLQTIKEIKKRKAELFLEIGPKRVLTKLLKRTDATLLATNIEDKESLEKVKDFIKLRH